MYKLLLSVLVVIVAAFSFIYLFPDQTAALLQGTPLDKPLSTSTPMYKWQDAQGRWQVSDTPPSEGVPYELKQYSLDTNVLPLPDELRDRD